MILFPYLQILSHLSLLMTAPYQVKQKCHLTAPSWSRKKWLNQTVLPLRPLHKTRTAEMQLKDNRTEVTEELRNTLSLIVAWNPMTAWNKIPSHPPLVTPQEKSEAASVRVDLSPQGREHNPSAVPGHPTGNAKWAGDRAVCAQNWTRCGAAQGLTTVLKITLFRHTDLIPTLPVQHYL